MQRRSRAHLRNVSAARWRFPWWSAPSSGAADRADAGSGWIPAYRVFARLAATSCGCQAVVASSWWRRGVCHGTGYGLLPGSLCKAVADARRARAGYGQPALWPVVQVAMGNPALRVVHPKGDGWGQGGVNPALGVVPSLSPPGVDTVTSVEAGSCGVPAGCIGCEDDSQLHPFCGPFSLRNALERCQLCGCTVGHTDDCPTWDPKSDDELPW